MGGGTRAEAGYAGTETGEYQIDGGPCTAAGTMKGLDLGAEVWDYGGGSGDRGQGGG